MAAKKDTGLTVPAGFVRGFHHTGEAYYAEGLRDSRGGFGLDDGADYVMVGIYHAQGKGTNGEFRLAWNSRGQMLLTVYEDAWKALALFNDLVQWLAGREDVATTPKDLCAALVSMGVKDLTERTETAR